MLGWSSKASGNQVRETVTYFMDFNLSWLPLLSGLVLPNTSGTLLLPLGRGLPISWT